jgi:hypothetical protein
MNAKQTAFRDAWDTWRWPGSFAELEDARDLPEDVEVGPVCDRCQGGPTVLGNFSETSYSNYCILYDCPSNHPDDVLGVGLGGVADALRRWVAARP